MKNIVIELVMVLSLFAGLGAVAHAGPKPPMIPDEPARVCGNQGAACQGNADCCSGFSCQQKMETGKRSCQPE